jgi:hypothetical protein
VVCVFHADSSKAAGIQCPNHKFFE